jgi:hypothetical protein
VNYFLSVRLMLFMIGVILITFTTSENAFGQATHYCCQPDGCRNGTTNPCEELCTITHQVECNGIQYTIDCEGIRYLYATYHTPDGHNGCLESGDPIILCAAQYEYPVGCTGGPPPGTICQALQELIWYTAGTC